MTSGEKPARDRIHGSATRRTRHHEWSVRVNVRLHLQSSPASYSHGQGEEASPVHRRNAGRARQRRQRIQGLAELQSVTWWVGKVGQPMSASRAAVEAHEKGFGSNSTCRYQRWRKTALIRLSDKEGVARSRRVPAHVTIITTVGARITSRAYRGLDPQSALFLTEDGRPLAVKSRSLDAPRPCSPVLIAPFRRILTRAGWTGATRQSSGVMWLGAWPSAPRCTSFTIAPASTAGLRQWTGADRKLSPAAHGPGRSPGPSGVNPSLRQWSSSIRVSSSKGPAGSPSSKSCLVSSKLLLLPSRREDDQDRSMSSCSNTSRA